MCVTFNQCWIIQKQTLCRNGRECPLPLSLPKSYWVGLIFVPKQIFTNYTSFTMVVSFCKRMETDECVRRYPRPKFMPDNNRDQSGNSNGRAYLATKVTTIVVISLLLSNSEIICTLSDNGLTQRQFSITRWAWISSYYYTKFFLGQWCLYDLWL